MRNVLALALGAATLLIAASPPLQNPAAIELTDTDGPFQDIGTISAEAMNNNCLACHSSAMVISQPAPSPQQWRATLAKMKTVFHAPIEAEDDAAILAWLEANTAKQSATQPGDQPGG